MSIVTVWTNPTNEIKLHQLSDDPADGSAQEQIAHLETLEPFAGFQCVSADYKGAAPETDALLWRWDGTQITSLPAPAPEPTADQIATVLKQLGMTDAQLSNLFAAASAL